MNLELNTYRVSQEGERMEVGSEKAFSIPADAKNYKVYIDALYEACATLTPAAIASGAETVGNAMRRDIILYPDTVKASGKTYYISNNGDDQNDGLSPETAWATAEKLNEMTETLRPGDAVLFERGGIWRKPLQASLTEEPIFIAAEGVSYGAYGVGPKPKFFGSTRNYADPELWVETERPNIYKCTVKFKNAGIIALDHSENYGRYDETVAFKEIIGLKGFNGLDDLRIDCSYYHQCEEQDVYFYSEKGNPGERFKSIEIGGRQAIIRIDHAARIENFDVRYDGYGFAISRFSPYNTMNIHGCIFCYIGGVLGSPITGRTTICGNAIELYGACDGFYVEDCWMYQICDTGITHQNWRKVDEYIQKNIRFVGNVVEYCHWAIEYNNAPTTDGALHSIENCYHGYNFLAHGGEGFGSVHFQRKERGVLYNSFGSGYSENVVCEKNILYKSAGSLYRMRFDEDRKIEYNCNINIQTLGKRLGFLYDDDNPDIYTPEAIKKLGTVSRQSGAVYVVVE